MHQLVEVYDEMENYLPSLLELFRIIESRGINKNDIINVLKDNQYWAITNIYKRKWLI